MTNETEELYYVVQNRGTPYSPRYTVPTLEPMPKPARRRRWKDPLPTERVLHEETIPEEQPIIRHDVLAREARHLAYRLQRDRNWKWRQGDRTGAEELDQYIELAHSIANKLEERV